MATDIYTKLAKVAGEIGAINKTERNKEQGFNFRSIEQITGAVRPLFAAEGITVAPLVRSIESSEVTSAKGSRGFRTIVEMEYIFYAGSDGSTMMTSMVGEAVDYGDKSTSKAVQMAYKYALTQILQVGSGDDPDAHSVDVGHDAEARPRPRSGMRRTPSTEASQRPPNGAQAHLTVDQVADLARIKTELLSRVDGNRQEARRLWEGTIATFGLDPGDPIPADMIGPIEHAVKALAIKGDDE